MKKSKGKLYAGSRQLNQFVVIHAEEQDDEEKKEIVEPQNSESDEGLICRICEEDVDRTSEGEIFVACNECAFPVCRACYDYERIEGNTTCPQCRTRYKRLKGSARVEGDEEETEVDDIDSEFNLLPRVEHPPSSISSNFSDGSPDLRLVPYYEGSDVPSECHTHMSSQADDERQLAIVTSYGHGTVVWKGETDEDWKNKQIVLHMERIEEEQEQENRVEHHNESLKVMGDGGNQQPLSRKMLIGSSMINPYRIVIVLRLVVLGFFFHYRILNPVPHAYGLWLTSVICEIWFAISWILDQFPKWYPIERETYLDRLTLRYDKEGQPSELAGIDVFVSTVDPLKEPPLITANTVLSILAVDYPVDKVSCYVSDDGGSMLTFQALSDAFAFAVKWVPFCKKFNIEPRAPEWYFAQKVDYLKDKTHPSFVRERRMMKREYEKFKIHINHLVEENEKAHEKGWILPGGVPWPAQNSRDHPSLIQYFVEEEGQYVYEEDRIPKLFYVSREKRPGFDHHKKAGAMNALVRVSAVISNAPYILNVDCDHYINNSKALREAMCFMMDPDTGKKICYVQFPQRFDGIDKNDRYSNRNVVFFDINMKGLDGIQGPIYVGTGCVFRREALYGYDAPGKKTPRKTCNCWLKLCCLCCNKRRKAKKAKKKHKHTTKQKDALKTNAYYGVDSDIEALIPQEKPEKKFGHSTAFLASLQEKEEFPGSHGLSSRLSEAMHVVGCGYEDKTEWGKEVGWIYGSVTEDILTGFKMHCHGWRSVYCIPKRPAFKGSAPINLSDRLHQVLRWALGSVEILLSRHCPIWYGYGSGLKRLERFSYVNSVVYPLTSIPLIIYCTLPAICLLTGDFIVPEIGVYAAILFLSLFVSIAATSTLEIYWGGISLDDLWRNEQFWVIGGVSSHFFAIFQGLLKVIGGVETSFTVTSKGGDDGAFSELYTLKWTTLLIPPTTLLVLNIIGVFAGIADAVNNGYKSWILLFGKFLFAFWVIIHLYPFLKGMMGKQNKVPTVVWVWSTILAIVSSLLWARVNPFGGGGNSDGPILEVCGLQCT